MSIFKSIGEFFAHLFDGVKATWKRLPTDVQNALLYGSGVLSFINDNLDKTPEFVLDLIKTKFPNFDEAHLAAAIADATKDLAIAKSINSTDLLTTIKNLQTYMAGLQGASWKKISNYLAQGIALFTAPAGTEFGIITSIIEFVYQTFFRKKTI